MLSISRGDCWGAGGPGRGAALGLMWEGEPRERLHHGEPAQGGQAELSATSPLLLSAQSRVFEFKIKTCVVCCNSLLFQGVQGKGP